MKHALTPLVAVTVTSFAFALDDPANDFLSTYTGPQAGDVDVLSASVAYDGTDYIFKATMNGDIGTTSGALYVWGFNRGQGTARFSPNIPGTEDILFDSVVLMRPDTTMTVNRIVGGGSTNFGAGSVLVNGASISARVAATELPSLGFSLDKYTWNLWPRVGTGNNNQISDFAPDHTNAAVDVVPEPASIIALGGALLAVAKRRR